MDLSLGSARPMLAAMSRCASFVEFSLMTVKATRSEEHTSELQSPCNLVCRLLLEKKKRCQKIWEFSMPIRSSLLIFHAKSHLVRFNLCLGVTCYAYGDMELLVIACTAAMEHSRQS